MNRPRFWFLLALAVAAAASRVVPHPSNFSPMAAVALFGAATFDHRRSAILVPLGALLFSDLLLHLTHLAGWQTHWGFYSGQWVVYACALVTVGIGFLLRRRRTAPAIALATLSSSLVFFLVTNFVWAYGPDSLYPKNLQGLMASYTAALPFFRNSLAGDAFYSTLLFGTLALAEARFKAIRQPATSPEPSFATAG
jgi:hypothetical protein